MRAWDKFPGCHLGGEWDAFSSSVSMDVGTDSDSIASEQEEDSGSIKPLNAGSEFQEGGPCTRDASGSSIELDETIEGFLETCIKEKKYDFQSCLEVLRKYVLKFPTLRRRGLIGDASYAILGLYKGGIHGVTSFARQNEGITRYLNQFIVHQNPMGRWTTVYLSRNTTMPLHKDTRNSRQGETWIVALGDFIGGGLWVDSGNMSGPCLRRLPDGQLRAGSILDIHESPQFFNSLGWHEAEPWSGNDRWVIVAYSPLNFHEALAENEQPLMDLGFPLPVVPDTQGVPCGEVDGSTNSKFKACPVSLADDSAELKQRRQGQAIAEDSWVVEFPLELSESYEDGVQQHQAALDFCLQMVQELPMSILHGEGSEMARLVRVARLEVSWWETALRLLQPAMETCSSVWVASATVPLGERAPEPDELFLQTRIISLDQVRKALSLWESPAREEIDNLENVMQALERVTTRDIELWTAQGYKVTQIPGKAVTSRKSGTGRRKFRAVACGNYLESSSTSSASGDSLYASGVDSSTVRLAIAHAASHSDWVGVVADVECAFLHAPRRQTNVGEIWVIRPPYLLVELGILKPSDRWKINKAIYGLRSSP